MAERIPTVTVERSTAYYYHGQLVCLFGSATHLILVPRIPLYLYLALSLTAIELLSQADSGVYRVAFLNRDHRHRLRLALDWSPSSVRLADHANTRASANQGWGKRPMFVVARFAEGRLATLTAEAQPRGREASIHRLAYQ